VPNLASALVRASHPGPTAIVTVVVGALAFAAGHEPRRGGLLVLAVLTGQLSIGWSNDLVDADRDQRTGRGDKPLATGALGTRIVRAALVVSVVVCAVASLACGIAAGTVHLVLGVGSGWAYNLGLKRGRLSWLPDAVGFGSLPAFVFLALDPPQMPPGWLVLAAALLGVAAHLLNALPDLADDAATQVRGLPHRLGPVHSQLLAVVLLVLTSVVVAIGGPGPVRALGWVTIVVTVLLAAASLRAGGRRGLGYVMAIAALNVVALIIVGL